MNCQLLSHGDFSFQSKFAILQRRIGVFVLHGSDRTPLCNQAIFYYGSTVFC
jgi:hypothetical protein